MPIEKHVVSHRFGIFTENRRNELVHTAVSGESLRNSCLKTENDESACRTVELVNLLKASSVTEKELISLEDEASGILKKVKFKLSNICKKGFNDLKECWSDLALFISCKSRKLEYDALCLLQRSLCDAPLSKSVLPVLIEVGVSSIHGLLGEDRILCLWETKTLLLAEVTFLICSRLYYHFLVQDLKQTETGKIEQLQSLNKALNEIVTRFQDNPILHNLLRVITCMITAICPSATGTAFEIGSPKSESISHVDDSTDNERTVDNKVERPPLASFLWNCLKLWKSASRQLELQQGTVEKLFLTDFSMINTKHIQWLDCTVAFYTLCECSKLKIEYLNIFLQFKTKMTPKLNKTSPRLNKSEENLNDGSKWNLDIVITYLKCLADICMFGIGTPTQKLALLGNEKQYGLTNYLTHVPDDDDGDSFKIRLCAYQLLCDTYSFYQSDPMKDGLKNVAWNSIMKFKSCDSNKLILDISQSYKVKTIDQHHSILSVFSKICTNLCIVAFSPCLPPVKSRNVIEDSKRRPQTSKCFEKEKEVNSTKKIRSPRSENKSKEIECWSEVQRIVEDHFKNELMVDEIEKERLRLQQKLEEGEVASTLAGDE